MKNDKELQDRVLSALSWEPSVDAADIGVTVHDGVVTLRGTVKTLSEKWIAERTVRHVAGVRALANDVEVTPVGPVGRSDSAIAAAAANALEWDTAVPAGVQATVRDGWVTLTGTAPWYFQREAAERAVRPLFGVKGIVNEIIVKPAVRASDVKAKIESAFKRSAEIDAQQVKVDVRNGEVVLTGTVHSLLERQEAERAAWAAPGVSKVKDQLVVMP